MKIWWCNQSRQWNVERRASVVCSSEDADNLTFRKTVAQIEPGDIILHYVKQNVVAVSLAKSKGVHYTRLPLLGDQDYEAGWRAEVEYFVFYPVIPKKKFASSLLALRETAGIGFPIDKGGDICQGYLYPFTNEGLRIIRTGRGILPHTGWADESGGFSQNTSASPRWQQHHRRTIDC